jgi:hypothetical protein
MTDEGTWYRELLPHPPSMTVMLSHLQSRPVGNLAWRQVVGRGRSGSIPQLSSLRRPGPPSKRELIEMAW